MMHTSCSAHFINNRLSSPVLSLTAFLLLLCPIVSYGCPIRPEVVGGKPIFSSAEADSCTFPAAEAWAQSISCSGPIEGAIGPPECAPFEWAGTPKVTIPITNGYGVSTDGKGYFMKWAEVACGIKNKCGENLQPEASRAYTETFLEVGSSSVKPEQIDQTCPLYNAVLPGSGEERHAETDFQSGRLAFRRYYSSGGYTHYVKHGLDSYINKAPTPYPFWSHTYLSRIVAPNDTSGTVMMVSTRANLTYKRFGFDGLEIGATEGGRDRIVKLVDGAGATTGWQYISVADGGLETYDANGMLLSIEARDGYKQTLAYVTVNAEPVVLSVTDSHSRTLVFTYDAKARLINVQTPSNLALEYGYDVSGNMVEARFVTASGTTTRTYQYGNATYTRSLTGIIDEKSQQYLTFRYDNYGRLAEEYLAGGLGRVLLQYTAGQTTVTKPNGSDVIFDHNMRGNVRKIISTSEVCTQCSGENIYQTFDSQGFRDIASDSNGTTTNTDYNSRGLLTQQIESANLAATKRTTQTDWHATFNVPLERRVLNAANTLEARSTYAYNSRGQATAMCQIDPNNSTAMAYVCGSSTNAPVGVRQSTSTYCEQADITAGTCPLIGLAIASNGPRTDVSDITTFTYYQADDASCATAPTTCPHRKGDLWKVTNALNQTSETTAYDGAGRALQMKDANNVITDIEYNPRGWLTARKVRGSDNASEADDAITRMEYDLTGQVTKVIQAGGDFVSFNYDAAHRLTSITDALGNSITYTLDNAGNRTAETTKDPSNTVKRSLSRVYDTLGRLQISKNAANVALATLTYDANDNLNTATDGLNRVTDQDVDPLNRLIKTIQDQGVGKINATTQFEYDARDNLTKVIDPKNLNTVYNYNGLNDLTALSSPDTGTTSYTYDSAGNRKTQTDARNKTSTFSYDVANRLTAVNMPTVAQNVYFDYDATQTDCQVGETYTAGRMARIRDESGSTRYCYNRLGQAVRKVQSVTGGPSLTLGSTYNAANRMVAMTYPSGAIVTYLRNANGQIVGVDAQPTAVSAQVSMVSNATYLPFGPLNTLTFGNGRVLTKAYDQNYNIDKVSDNSSTGLSEDSTVNVMGNITTITERTNATSNATRRFAYDNLDRLLSLKNGSTNVQSFTYDATGNRLNKTLGTTVTTNTLDASSHRLTQTGAIARSYDANGNTATIGAKAYEYDDRNRLRDYKNSGTTVTRTYRYNGKGERVSKVVSATSTSNRYYFYDEAGHLLGEYLANGTRVQEYVWLDDQLVAVLSDHDASTYQFVETDHLGTPRAVIHPVENNIVWRWNITNTAFGEHAASNNPDADAVTYTFNLRYPGQFYDSESGLHQNGFRDYEPGTGRYSQSDPIGMYGGMATYSYANNAATTGYDRLGLCWSDTRGVAHYATGGGREIDLDEAGCTSIVSNKIQPERAVWIAKVKADAKALALTMTCGTWKRMETKKSIGMHSGVYWIGGFSLLQSSNCIVQRSCADEGLQCRKMDSYSFDCLLKNRMHDKFQKPADRDNDNADFYDDFNPGTEFYVNHNWFDQISGGGPL